MEPHSNHSREQNKIQPAQKKSSTPSKFLNKPKSITSYTSSSDDEPERNRSGGSIEEQDLTHEVLFYWKEMDVEKSSADSA